MRVGAVFFAVVSLSYPFATARAEGDGLDDVPPSTEQIMAESQRLQSEGVALEQKNAALVRHGDDLTAESERLNRDWDAYKVRWADDDRDAASYLAQCAHPPDDPSYQRCLAWYERRGPLNDAKTRNWAELDQREQNQKGLWEIQKNDVDALKKSCADHQRNSSAFSVRQDRWLKARAAKLKLPCNIADESCLRQIFDGSKPATSTASGGAGGDCSMACIAACPTHSGPFGTRIRDADCTTGCLRKCGE